MGFLFRTFLLAGFFSAYSMNLWGAEDCSEYYKERLEEQAASSQIFNVTCRYTAQQIEKDGEYYDHPYFQVKFKYDIKSSSEASIDYEGYVAGTKTVEDDGQTAQGIDAIFFGKKVAPNVPYKGKKYANHFKFRLAGYPGDYADLIIEKTPQILKEFKTWQYPGGSYKGTWVDCAHRRKTISYSFQGVLDVSYNDHHGDYARLTCESRKTIFLISE